MPYAYIIKASVDLTDATGPLAGDLFGCGVNESSEHYPSADAALMAARAAYKGPAIGAASCRVWAERLADEADQDDEVLIAAA